MTPVERWCLYGISILTLMFTASRVTEAWINRLETRYWKHH